jgi:hypothetical protein
MKRIVVRAAFALLVCGFMFAMITPAQSTAFTYQGRLSDGSIPANATYDMQFGLFDTQTVGTGVQHGSTLLLSAVTVANGIFTVQLDFGGCPTCFDGSPRFIEIAVKQTSASSFTTLGPRQPVTSAPYALRALDSSRLGGTAANVYVQTADPRLSDARPPTAGSADYVQNSTAQQPASNFNISGTGTAGIVNATGQYNFAGERVLGITGSTTFPNSNVFLGIAAGTANNPSGSIGVRNTFVGSNAGVANTSGTANSFFGSLAGQSNISGGGNSFFGRSSGLTHQSGSDNSYFGSSSGSTENGGIGNTFLGTFADGSNNLRNATAVGYRSFATQSHTLILGGISGANGCFAPNCDTIKVGIGTTSPTERLHVLGNQIVSGDLTVAGNLIATLPAGSASYIQNTNAPQAASNFNISGTGTANVFSAVMQFNIGTNRVLSVAGPQNVFVGVNAGNATTGDSNVFVGTAAGTANTSGFNNVFIGTEAGTANTTACCNTFVGAYSGETIAVGAHNSYFGQAAGPLSTGSNNSFFGSTSAFSNTTGELNSFFGYASGFANTTGSENSFFGRTSGRNNVSGGSNAFFGRSAGFSNVSGSNNTLVGAIADAGAPDLTFASAIGARAFVTQSNSLVLGAINGVNSATSDTNVGIGTTAPSSPLHLQRNAAPATNWQSAQFRISGSVNPAMQLNLGYDTTANKSVIQSGQASVAFTDLLLNPFGARVGIGTIAPTGNLHVRGGSPVRFIGETSTLTGSEYVDFMARSESFNSDLGGMRIQRQSGTGDIDTIIFAAAAGNAMSEALRIRGGGNVGIGTASPDQRLSVNGDASKIGGGAWLVFSDERLKNVGRRYDRGISALMQLEPVSYSYRNNNPLGITSDRTFVGFSAQSVRKAIPEAVTENNAGYLMINNDPILWTMLNSIKEQQSVIAAQASEIRLQNERQKVQQTQLELQRAQIDALKKLVCVQNREAEICKEEK